MKRFIVTILCVSVFFIGLGGLVDSVGARLKSDARALELIKAAQQAIGGDSAVRNVQSLTIVGKATKTFEIEGVARSEQGDWELNLQLPNKLSKMMRVEIGKNDSGEKSENKIFTVTKKDGGQVTFNSNEKPQADVVIVKRDGEGGGKIIVKEDDTSSDVKKEVIREKMRAEFEKHKQMELFRTTLSLLLSAPQGVEADYIYAGDGSVDGVSCDVIEARLGESSVKLFLDKASHLPRMMSYMDHKPMMMMFRMKKDDAKTEENTEKTQQTFERKVEAPPTEEFQIKFSDYRSVGGLLLPFKWTQTVGGRADETVDISSYEINPANIADKFQELPQKIMIRTEKKP